MRFPILWEFSKGKSDPQSVNRVTTMILNQSMIFAKPSVSTLRMHMLSTQAVPLHKHPQTPKNQPKHGNLQQSWRCLQRLRRACGSTKV